MALLLDPFAVRRGAAGAAFTRAEPVLGEPSAVVTQYDENRVFSQAEARESCHQVGNDAINI